MIESARSPVAMAARIVAVAFALCVLGYFVVTAQQRARWPVASSEPGIPESNSAGSPDSGPVEQGAFLPSSKSGNFGGPNPPPVEVQEFGVPGSGASAQQERAFLAGSKSMVITDIVNMADDSGGITVSEGESDVVSETPVTPAQEPQFLPSSKVRTLPGLTPRPPLEPGWTPESPPTVKPGQGQKLETKPAPKH